MATVFIVRPFGNSRPVIKKNKDGTPEIVFFDFDKVETDLIIPAMNETGLTGGTTQRIFEAGEIKEDMFSQLLLADIVIADITIHNANVFYELGIRHALREKTTVLIKCTGFDETPFDIIGYKYIDYQKDDPRAALKTLIQFLRDSPSSEKKDSPVFNMLPKLKEQNTEKFLAVPPDFIEEVEMAKAGKQPGMLVMLLSEAESFTWLLPALRVVGNAQFSLKAFEAAQVTWEKIRWNYPNDKEANERLATIYQRLAEEVMTSNSDTGVQWLSKSDQAIARLLESYSELTKKERAEVYSLKARNTKSRWVESWKNLLGVERQKKALQSKYLVEAYEDYERGYNEDLNHFYPGINALGLVTSLITLAESLPDAWEEEYNSKDESDLELKKYKEKKQKLSIMVQISVEAEKKRLQYEKSGARDSWIWMHITEADLACFISAKPSRVGNLYRDAIEDATGLNLDAAKRQLQIYEALQVAADNVKAALAEFAKIPEKGMHYKMHYLLFTGHMIDKRGREKPRFPASHEGLVRAAVKEAVQKEKEKHNGIIVAISGGGCGGDILFHEVCEEVGIKTDLYLALPREKFLQESVDFAGHEWVDRFDKLFRKLPTHVLSQRKELPKWLQKKPDYTIWERNNLWMLNKALECGGIQMTLMALWDGKGGDGAGGTEHMVKTAKEKGARTIVIDINTL